MKSIIVVSLISAVLFILSGISERLMQENLDISDWSNRLAWMILCMSFNLFWNRFKLYSVPLLLISSYLLQKIGFHFISV